MRNAAFVLMLLWLICMAVPGTAHTGTLVGTIEVGVLANLAENLIER